MRWLPLLVSSLIASTASAAPSSNPAFLGIKMFDRGIGCGIDGVTPGSAAQDAGLREDDLILKIDDVATPRCDLLKNQIVSTAPGQTVRIQLKRGGEQKVIPVVLSTRADVLHRRVVGRTLDATSLADADNDKQSYDLADQRGKTTVVGWFRVDRCVGCAAVFDRVADGIAKRLANSPLPPLVLAVTASPDSPMPQLRTVPGGVMQLSAPKSTKQVRRTYAFTSTLPLAVAPEDTFEDLAIDDPERVYFTVIDCRGIVRFVAPVAPGSEDFEAAIDEVLAAAEQAENQRTHRR